MSWDCSMENLKEKCYERLDLAALPQILEHHSTIRCGGIVQINLALFNTVDLVQLTGLTFNFRAKHIT